MAETETYTVTKRAGPRVAGRPAKAGQELQLTELQARAELLAGSIVNGGKADEGAKGKDGKAPPDPFAGSDELRHIRARARGLDAAPEEAGAAPAEKAADPKQPAGGGAPPATVDGKTGSGA